VDGVDALYTRSSALAAVLNRDVLIRLLQRGNRDGGIRASCSIANMCVSRTAVERRYGKPFVGAGQIIPGQGWVIEFVNLTLRAPTANEICLLSLSP